jgi:5-amino-6-(5-phosphoribosylamino)uracil reductase
LRGFRPWLRLVLAVSLDGRLAPPAGGPAQLGGAGDRRALEEALAWADACLIGARTLRLHGSTCLLRCPDLLERRRLRGHRPQPIAIAVSRSAHLPQDLPFFRQPLERWLLHVSPAAAEPREAPGGFRRTLQLPDWPSALQALSAAGLGRVALLGGACLAGALLQEDLVDELQLTLCPQLLAGAHTWVPADCRLALCLQGGWRLVEHRSLGGEELLLRYRLDRSPGSAPAARPSLAASCPDDAALAPP